MAYKEYRPLKTENSFLITQNYPVYNVISPSYSINNISLVEGNPFQNQEQNLGSNFSSSSTNIGVEPVFLAN